MLCALQAMLNYLDAVVVAATVIGVVVVIAVVVTKAA